MLGLVQNTEPTEPAKDAVRMWEQWLGIVLNQSIMILFYRGELYSTLHNSFYFPLPGDTSFYCLPVTGRDFANFAADRVRHSFARHCKAAAFDAHGLVCSNSATCLHYISAISSCSLLIHATSISSRSANCSSSHREHDPEDWQVARPSAPFADRFILRRER